MPDLSLNCQSLYDLPQWMRDKFCYKCETDDLDALYGVDQLPWAGGPYGEFDASYCACCEEKPGSACLEHGSFFVFIILKPIQIHPT